jgi:hypothetical protein
LKFSQTPFVKSWIDQFAASDRGDAADLLDAMHLVSFNAFLTGLRSLILERAGETVGPVALYAEREWKKYKGRANRLFKEQKRGKTLRAIGAGPKPITSPTTINPEIGSEGIVAWLITELCRENPDKFISHPGPDQIRSKRIRGFFLVTDFVGTGNRASNYLDAAWRVASVKSWHSGKQLIFEVIAYSSTLVGRIKVKNHPLRPRLEVVILSPSIDREFGLRASSIKSLCERYDPLEARSTESLGYGGVGALIAFAHGCPNNVPRLLYKTKKGSGWRPLFKQRVTAPSRIHFENDRSHSDDQEKLRRMGFEKLADSPWLSRLTTDGRSLVVLLSALRRGRRDDESLSYRTGLNLPELRSLIAIAATYGWIDNSRRLTRLGRGEITHQLVSKGGHGDLSEDRNLLYVPKSLRVP